MILPFRLLFPLYCFFALVNINFTAAGDLVPFPIPWDDAAPAITSLTHLLDPPAGKDGFIRLQDDDFVDGQGNRIRFLGVNLAFSANFPTHAQAEAVAAHLAKYGINCVRFHHLDTMRAPDGIWLEGTAEKQQLDPERLDRLDYLIHQLKRNGIYSDLNLKVARKTVPADGIPQADQLPTYDKGPDHYHPRLIRLQKDYARDLLTHVNPYTGNPYTREPAIAVIEINNESGLLQTWRSGDLDALPAAINQPLQERWNRYLRDRYASTAELRQAWQDPQVETEVLIDDLSGWNLQSQGGAQAVKSLTDDTPADGRALQLSVTRPGNADWHVQLVHPGLSLQKHAFYKLLIRMKSDDFRTVSLGIRLNQDPWSFLDRTVAVELTPEWKSYELTFSPSADSSNARLDITGLGLQTGILLMASPVFTRTNRDGLPDSVSLEEQTIPWISSADYSRMSLTARSDWMRFLLQTETDYYRELHDYLRRELGAQSMIAGTQLGFGAIPSQFPNDYIDIHGYWQHPLFPGRNWDQKNWYVNNESIVNTPRNALTGIMESQIAGRAYTLSEYNHPSPNTYSSEGIPLAAAYGAFHDWDGIFYFAYSHSNRYEEKSINNFFDIAGNTPKMLALPAAANMFLRGDIQEAHTTYTAALPLESYVQNLIDTTGNTWLRPFEQLENPFQAVYQHRTVLRLDSTSAPTGNQPEIDTKTRAHASDTGQLLWYFDPQNRSYVLIRSSKTKGLIGFTAHAPYDLQDGIQLEIGETRQQWANVLLTFMKNDAEGDHWLLTATGYAENQGMKWTSEEKISVGSDWGSGPPLVEAIPLRLTYGETPVPPRLYALDNRGQRSVERTAAVSSSEKTVVIDLMDQPQHLWYELVFPTRTDVEPAVDQ